ncbi:MAG TPA: NAD(P)-dependent alcohol dehydrogenase [Xanthobacteraceae bacterium]|jgi:aryl-alcohol dehydrogenase|nr:NAD(P)-dependent alcohol dehydrogenase [Xanthobacteraceae bacterium]
MRITAAVINERSSPFVIDTLELTEPRADELVVRVVASGMCQTDLHGRDGYYANPVPAVFGHEGAGVVHAVGSAVTSFKPGDHVVMSFPWCGACANCAAERRSYCVHARDLKMAGTRADGSFLLSRGGTPVHSAFFQQSSFGTYALTQERYAVKVREDAPLDLLGPLACSGQTGAGAVLNVLKPKTGDSIAVFGVGAVGLSALMAAKIAGCDPIIAVDVHPKRLALARELGAMHVIDHSAVKNVVGEICGLTGGGVKHSIETSALPPVFREAIESLMPGGTCVLLGSARKGNDVSIEMPFLQEGRTVRGVVQGDSVPKTFIPKLVDLIMDGKFPIEKMIKFYELADINVAAVESSNGTTIKPVIRMPARA